MIICNQCGTTVEDRERFCSECGTPVLTTTTTPAPAVTPAQPVQTQPQQTAYSVSASGAPPLGLGATVPFEATRVSGQPISSSMAPKIIVGVVAAVLVLVVIVALVMRTGGASVEKKLDDAIARKNLFGPASDNAYALYNELKNSGSSEETLRPYADRLTPLLTESALKLIKDFQVVGYDEPDVNIWQDAARNLKWAGELNPGNSMIASRAAYADGRAAYLQKQNDRALSSWTRAMNLDKNWALPVNGVGMIYLDRKDFSNARASFADAIRREAEWAIPYSNMGYAYYQGGNRSSARDFFNKAVAKAPNWARPHMQLGNIAMEDGDYPTAISEFETALNPNLIGLKADDSRKIQDALDRARSRSQGF